MLFRTLPEIVRKPSLLCSVLLCSSECVIVAQTRPSLRLDYEGGSYRLNVLGDDGAVYSIQTASDLSKANPWVNKTLVQVRGTNASWSDPAASTGQRYYRAVFEPAPANTNLVFLPPGTFTMGSPATETDRLSNEGPQTQVTLSKGFWINKYLVTQADYLAVMSNNPSYYNGVQGANDYGTNLSRPVERVSFGDARQYCAVRTARELVVGATTNFVYRLPTEAEWEYACRAGTTSRFYYGDDPGYTNLATYAWYSANSARQTHSVGTLQPNPWGLYDMGGNLNEWCQDWLGTYRGGSVVDPQGQDPSNAAIRGGGWLDDGPICRSAQRYSEARIVSFYDFGFRIVMVQAQ